MVNEDAGVRRKFSFKATLPIRVREARRLPAHRIFSVTITQAQFEDYAYLRARVRAELSNLDLLRYEPAWHEEPPVDDALLSRLQEAVGAASDAVLIPYYQHGSRFTHYHSVVLGDQHYRYMGFQGGHFVKVAPHPGPWPARHGPDKFQALASANVVMANRLT